MFHVKQSSRTGRLLRPCLRDLASPARGASALVGRPCCSIAAISAFRAANARPEASAPPASCRRCVPPARWCAAGSFAASGALRSRAPSWPHNRDRPAARGLRRAGTPRYRRPGGRDRQHTWRRFRVAGDRSADFGELRPDPDDVGHADIRIRQQLERAAPLAVLVEREAVARRLVRRERQRLRKRPRRLQRRHLRAECRRR